MAAELVFYTNPMSRGRIVRWMLEEVGQPYKTEIMDYAGALKSPAYLAVNPMGKIPAIKHGEVVVTECAAICTYLADAFPEAGLAPAPQDRGLYYRWLFFAAGPVESAITNKSLGVTVSSEQSRMVGYGSEEAVVDALERAVTANPYIAGDKFSAADVYVGSQIGWGMAFGSIAPRPAFQDYVKKITARPAYAKAQEIDGPMPGN